MSEALFLTRGDGRQIDLGTFSMTLKAGGEENGGLFSLLEAEEPPGFAPPLHIHHDAAEAFYVLEGEYVMYLGDREVTCPAGSFIFIPAGVRHGFKVGAAPSRKLNLFFPAAMVGYFDELSAAIARGDADDALDAIARGDADDALDAIATGHAMEIVGPVPGSYV